MNFKILVASTGWRGSQPLSFVKSAIVQTCFSVAQLKHCNTIKGEAWLSSIKDTGCGVCTVEVVELWIDRIHWKVISSGLLLGSVHYLREGGGARKIRGGINFWGQVLHYIS